MAGKHAGTSAREMSVRTREKAARLNKAADAWEAGADGEEATGRALAGLDDVEWTVLHDVCWPGRPKANLDHVVIGPAGVFVIDSKNWSGVVSFKDGVLRQDGRPRDTAVTQAAEAADAVQGLVPGVPVHAVICLVQGDPAEGLIGDVLIRSPKNLCEMLITRPPALGAMDVWRTQSTLEQKLRTSSARTPAAAAADRGTSRRPALGRLVAALAMIGVLVGGLQTGAFTHVGSVVSDLVVGVSNDDPAPDQPQDRPKNKNKNKGKKPDTKRDRA